MATERFNDIGQQNFANFKNNKATRDEQKVSKMQFSKKTDCFYPQ